MSKLVSLLRATMSEGIQLFNYRGNTERSRRVMPVVLAVLIGLVMLYTAFAMGEEMKEDGGVEALLSLFTMATAIIIVMEGVYKAGDLLFKPRDNDALLAMPIKKPTIVMARMIKFYVFEMLYCLIFLLPAIIAYAMNVEVPASYYVVAATMLILVPVIPIAISCIVGLITSAIATRFQHRTVLEVVLSFVFLFGMVIVIMKMNTATGFDGQAMRAVGERVGELYYPAGAFMKLAVQFDIWQYLLFVMVNMAVLAVTVLVISRFYFKIVSRMNIVKRKENARLDYSFKRHGQTFAMVRKEMNRYFSTPVLLVNTAMGLVIFLVVAGALCWKFDEIATSIALSVENFPLTIEEMRGYLPAMSFGLVAFASLMTFITATMISLEGKAFNALKSMPISGVKVIMTKVLAAMLLIVPVTAIGVVVMSVRFQFGVIDTLLVLFGTVVLALVTELVGILVNLKYARFDAENDAVVVRQSASVMVSTFMGLFMVMVTISLTFAAVFFAGQTMGLLMMDAMFAVVAGFLYFAVVTRGKERYGEISA